jgi:hypothetical protein
MSPPSPSPAAVGAAFVSSWAAALSPSSARALRAARAVLSLSVVLAATAAVWFAVVIAAVGTMAVVRSPDLAAAVLAATASRVVRRRQRLSARPELPGSAPPADPAN